MEPENNGELRDDKGRFGKGNPGKPKGAASNSSAKVKAAIVDFLERNTEKIQEDFDQMKPRERLQFISDILPYATPKLSSVQSEVEGTITGEWIISMNIDGSNKVRKALDAGVSETDN